MTFEDMPATNTDTVKDPTFGDIIDYQRLRDGMMDVLDHVFPTFNLMGSMLEATRLFGNNPSYMTACAASGLAYMMLVAAEEDELAARLKGEIFTLAWTEEHTGTDLLSIRTEAAPLNGDPNSKHYHIKGQKWLINNSYHADYHSVIAKVDPGASGPRSLSIFAVPHSSTKNWQRLETHVLRTMVLTKFEIDGPGILIGQVGRGLQILQRMACPPSITAPTWVSQWSRIRCPPRSSISRASIFSAAIPFSSAMSFANSITSPCKPR